MAKVITVTITVFCLMSSLFIHPSDGGGGSMGKRRHSQHSRRQQQHQQQHQQQQHQQQQQDQQQQTGAGGHAKASQKVLRQSRGKYMMKEEVVRKTEHTYPCRLVRSAVKVTFPGMESEVLVSFLGYKEPNLMHVMRCKGLCSSGTLSPAACVATRRRLKKVDMHLKTQVLGSSDAREKFRELVLEEHEECGCQCLTLGPGHCMEPGLFNNNTCACACDTTSPYSGRRDQLQCEALHSDRHWDPVTCSCRRHDEVVYHQAVYEQLAGEGLFGHGVNSDDVASGGRGGRGPEEGNSLGSKLTRQGHDVELAIPGCVPGTFCPDCPGHEHHHQGQGQGQGGAAAAMPKSTTTTTAAGGSWGIMTAIIGGKSWTAAALFGVTLVLVALLASSTMYFWRKSSSSSSSSHRHRSKSATDSDLTPGAAEQAAADVKKLRDGGGDGAAAAPATSSSSDRSRRVSPHGQRPLEPEGPKKGPHDQLSLYIDSDDKVAVTSEAMNAAGAVAVPEAAAAAAATPEPERMDETHLQLRRQQQQQQQRLQRPRNLFLQDQGEEDRRQAAAALTSGPIGGGRGQDRLKDEFAADLTAQLRLLCQQGRVLHLLEDTDDCADNGNVDGEVMRSEDHHHLHHHLHNHHHLAPTTSTTTNTTTNTALEKSDGPSSGRVARDGRQQGRNQHQHHRHRHRCGNGRKRMARAASLSDLDQEAVVAAAAASGRGGVGNGVRHDVGGHGPSWPSSTVPREFHVFTALEGTDIVATATARCPAASASTVHPAETVSTALAAAAFAPLVFSAAAAAASAAAAAAASSSSGNVASHDPRDQEDHRHPLMLLDESDSGRRQLESNGSSSLFNCPSRTGDTVDNDGAHLGGLLPRQHLQREPGGANHQASHHLPEEELPPQKPRAAPECQRRRRVPASSAPTPKKGFQRHHHQEGAVDPDPGHPRLDMLLLEPPQHHHSKPANFQHHHRSQGQLPTGGDTDDFLKQCLISLSGDFEGQDTDHYSPDC